MVGQGSNITLDEAWVQRFHVAVGRSLKLRIRDNLHYKFLK